MKKLLFSAAILFLTSSATKAQVDSNGYTTVNATMGAFYPNRVFFDFAQNKLSVQPADNWDIAFYRNSKFDVGVRINDAMKVQTFQVSNDPSKWDAITTMTTPFDPMLAMYNPNETDRIQDGAFSQGKPDCGNGGLSTGFGCYNFGTHHIEGKVIYILKYDNNQRIKFMITDYYGGYTFKYAKWDNVKYAWGETIEKTIENGSADTYFNYYSFTKDAEVPANEPPKNDWELMFTRYRKYFEKPYKVMYLMAGIIQSPRIEVAKETETQDVPTATIPAATDFKKTITTIGDSWKNITELLPNIVYYIKIEDEKKYYRMYFTKNGGQTTGNMYFKYKDISSQLGTSEFGNTVKFGIFPNPAPNKQVSLIYDLKEAINQGKIEIYDMAGRKVFETQINRTSGFFKQDINLNHLQSGVYIVKFITNSGVESKKLILK